MSPTPAASPCLWSTMTGRLRHAIRRFCGRPVITVRHGGAGGRAVLTRWPMGSDVMLLDIGLPGISGSTCSRSPARRRSAARVIDHASDETQKRCSGVRGQPDRYVTKPFAPGTIVEVVEDVLAEPAGPPRCRFEVVSAQPEWVELVAPCR